MDREAEVTTVRLPGVSIVLYYVGNTTLALADYLQQILAVCLCALCPGVPVCLGEAEPRGGGLLPRQLRRSRGPREAVRGSQQRRPPSSGQAQCARRSLQVGFIFRTLP